MNKVISVYFNGTSEKDTIPDSGNISLATLLYAMTEVDNTNNFSICVEGCGVKSSDWRDLGGIFAFHLKKQVMNVVAQIEKIVRESETDNPIILNIFGFSRGGVAAFLLCQELKNYPIERLKINLFAIDPVPGNFISSVYGDIFWGINSTLSASVADLTNCLNISDMLVLFTSSPMPAIVCHAPILPAYPSSCHTEVDVTLGCHQEALAWSKSGDEIYPENNESGIVLPRVLTFLEKSGTRFNYHRFNLSYLTFEKDVLLNHYHTLLKSDARKEPSSTRAMHLGNTIFKVPARKKFLNRHHQELSGVTAINDQDCLLTIEKNAPKPFHGMNQYLSLILMLAMMLIVFNTYANTSNLDNDILGKPGL